MDDDFGIIWGFIIVVWVFVLLAITGVFDKEPEPPLVCPPGHVLITYDTAYGEKVWCVLEEKK